LGGGGRWGVGVVGWGLACMGRRFAQLPRRSPTSHAGVRHAHANTLSSHLQALAVVRPLLWVVREEVWVHLLHDLAHQALALVCVHGCGRGGGRGQAGAVCWRSVPPGGFDRRRLLQRNWLLPRLGLGLDVQTSCLAA
jgi:hypothetical protein